VTEAELNARYPWLFDGKHIGREFPADGRREGRVWIEQQKEKLGALRCYLSVAPMRMDLMTDEGLITGDMPATPPPDVYHRLAPLIQAAEQESLKTCMVCGEPGVRRGREEGRLWILTLCNAHKDYHR
jgi:hypothetical protein